MSHPKNLLVWIENPEDTLDVLRYVHASDADVLRHPAVVAEVDKLRTEIALLTAKLKISDDERGRFRELMHADLPRVSEIVAEATARAERAEAALKTSWCGPCEHGSDPWERCDICEKLPGIVAERNALSAQVAILEDDTENLRAEASGLLKASEDHYDMAHQQLARAEQARALLATVRAERSENLTILRDRLRNLVIAMQTWGSWEDGVPAAGTGEYGSVGNAYDAACRLLVLDPKRPVKD
jgi:hypothetical protein